MDIKKEMEMMNPDTAKILNYILDYHAEQLSESIGLSVAETKDALIELLDKGCVKLVTDGDNIGLVATKLGAAVWFEDYPFMLNDIINDPRFY